MRFRLFGIPVQIQMSFWVTGVVLGMVRQSNPEVPRGAAVVTWIGVVLISVLVHELGHALTLKRYGIEPQITLYALGGLTQFQPSPRLRRRDHVLISLAGPLAGFLLGGLLFAAIGFWPHVFERLSPLGGFVVERLVEVNLGWGLLNLMPVLPLDGGHVLEHTLGPRRAQLTAGISTLVGFLVAALFVVKHVYFGAVLFGLAAIQSNRRFHAAGEPGSEPAPAPDAPPGTADAAQEAASLLARQDVAGARRVLEAARARGDDRKDVAGPLIQILIGQGEVAAAAAIALSIADDLSAEDARRMAALAVEHGAFSGAARLYGAMFDRLHEPEDAYEAARAEVQAGQPDRALDLLRRAVEAGFTDAARAWSDAALAPLRTGPALEAVLPRP